MPIYEYKCRTCGGISEEFFRSFSMAGTANVAPCVCGGKRDKIISVPLKPHLYGNPSGYHRPSPTKRFTTKVSSLTDGNKYSDG